MPCYGTGRNWSLAGHPSAGLQGQGKLCRRGWGEQNIQRWRTLIQRRDASGTEDISRTKAGWGKPAYRGLRISCSPSGILGRDILMCLFSLSSSLLCSTKLRLLLPIAFQRLWLGVQLIFPESILSFHVLC